MSAKNKRAAAAVALAYTTSVAAAALSIAPGIAGAAAPAVCGPAAQISDPVGDGHHNNTDAISAWFSESGGKVQGVIQTYQAVWSPAHDDSDAAGFSLLYRQVGVQRYVRALASRDGSIAYDYGTWSRSGGFVKQGQTTGSTVAGFHGTVTIDIPAEAGAQTGAVLANPFVLTYDGVDGTEPHWVDRAPGGISPDETAYGADFTVGSCSSTGTDGNTGGGSSTGGGAGGGNTTGSSALTGISLSGPAKVAGAGNVVLRGAITPVRSGVAVKLNLLSQGKTVTKQVSTGADGSFSSSFKATGTTSARATAGGLGSQTISIVNTPKLTLKIRRTKSRSVRIEGAVEPALPGRVLILRTTSVKASTSTKTKRSGRFKKTVKSLPKGRYQAVFIPASNFAERGISKSGVFK